MRFISDIEIRPAAVDDIPAIVRIGARFFDEAEWADVAEWDHDSICSTLRGMIADPNGIVLIAIREGVICGIAGGLVYPLYFNCNHITGQELFWWVEPEARKGVGAHLLDCLELAAMNAGAQSWAMIALDKVRPEAVGALYRRRGYRASEHSYIKRLG